MPNLTDIDRSDTLQLADSAYTFRSTAEIPEKFGSIFSCYQHFNGVQSRVLNDVLYTDKSLVVAAPTGSGKTVIFELAIVSLLIKLETKNYEGDFKIVYIAPIKALCSEKYRDWSMKFSQCGLRTLEVTGDTDTTEYSMLQNYHLIITTPEKWDSLTRKWKDNKHLMQVVKLIMIDEVHLLNDESRGPTMEAVVSRMKTVQGTILHDLRMHQAAFLREGWGDVEEENLDNEDIATLPMRFIAVSACIPNIEDVAVWLGDSECPAISYKFNEDMRPVRLKKVVLGFHCPDNWSSFRFSLTLMYKLKGILLSHASGKPTLIFCSTRKGVIQTSMVLFKDLTFHFTQHQREKLYYAANQLNEKKLKDLLLSGIGCHHAGIAPTDRYLVEDLFRAGYLPILVATSTLAMGVNLPAHLVVIMSTDQYVRGAYQEYPESQVLQMIGRAGRPQYDTDAVAVIMTKNQLKERYERLVEGQETLESNLHRHLAEHLNAEIVLHTITDVAVAMDWIHSTFLYVCASRRPSRYSITCPPSAPHKIESKLQELCMRDLNDLASSGVIILDGMDIKATEMGRLMARYCVTLETMKLFQKITGTETVIDLIKLICKSAEYSDIQLRTSERKILNCLSKNKGHECIRYPITTRVKTADHKINILIQAVLGCLQIQDAGLSQECVKIFRIGQRLSKCFCLYITSCWLKKGTKNNYKLLLSSLRLIKCFSSRLWEDSIFVARQLDRIGPSYAGLLAASGRTSFAALRDASPRDIERILNKAPPFGNDIKDFVNHLPEYKLTADKSGSIVTIEVSISNQELVKQHISTGGANHISALIAGEPTTNTLLLYENIYDAYIANSGKVIKTIDISNYPEAKCIKVHLVNEKWVGLDVEALIDVEDRGIKSESAREYLKRFAFSQSQGQELIKENEEHKKSTIVSQSMKNENSAKMSYIDKLKERVKMLPNTPSLKLKRGFQSLGSSQRSIDSYLSRDTIQERPQKLGVIENFCLQNEAKPPKIFIKDHQQRSSSSCATTIFDNFGPSSSIKRQDYYVNYNQFDEYTGDNLNMNCSISELYTPAPEIESGFIPDEDAGIYDETQLNHHSLRSLNMNDASGRICC
ncbi:probable ATP-dependent DNA helicase HFM1 isoform X2 [Ischnura elegans]|uniref:probable ATP-dependent DNA helicase HFM1 isoform X2 n=1 Tax=Ischnura elegans TaxID=197161 RepID=UPI001ED87FF9|nr:probable ATP-dependent DNA helicase HFM1 isoform X2 [Ischnura elegans]